MKNKNAELWNKEAVKSLNLKPIEWFVYYIGNSYIRATEKGLKYVNLKSKTNILKTDLWNEGIEYQRDILGKYQSYENFNLYGIDISHIVCSCAKSRVKKIHVACGDIRNLPFKDNSFDMILDLSTLDHIPENQVMDVLQEYKRVLKKDGILVLIFWYNSLLVKVRRYIKRERESNTQYYFSLKSIKNNVKDLFDIVEEYCIGTLLCVPYLGRILNRLPIFVRNPLINLTLNLEYSKISRFILKNFAGLYVIIARKS